MQPTSRGRARSQRPVDPLWLGRFGCRPGDCVACRRVAASCSAVWLFRGQVVALKLCTSCGDTAQAASETRRVELVHDEPTRRSKLRAADLELARGPS